MLAIESQYLAMLKQVSQTGNIKPLFSSQGEQASSYVISLFGGMLRHSFTEGFPIYWHRKIYWKGAIAEMLWFLTGKSDVAELRKMGCRIWDEWGYKAYCKELEQKYAGQLTPFSLDEWRNSLDEGDLQSELKLHYTNYVNWRNTGLNQTEWVLDQLTERPYRKCYHVSAWAPEDVYHMADQLGNDTVVLPACHLSHTLNCNQLHGVNMLSLSVHIRSNDLIAGNPFNVVQYGALLLMYVHCLNNRSTNERFWAADQLVVYIDDAHIYENQLGDAGQAIAKTYSFDSVDPCTLSIVERGQRSLQDFQLADLTLVNYTYAEKRKIAEVFVAGGH